MSWTKQLWWAKGRLSVRLFGSVCCCWIFIADEPLQSPALCAMFLAIAQKCNLGCTYCYASLGDFGGPAKNMAEEVTHRAADLLIESGQPGTRLNIAFLGG
jgi:uncharacterized protein